MKRNIQYKKALRLLGHKFSPKDKEEKYNWVDASIQYAYEYSDTR